MQNQNGGFPLIRHDDYLIIDGAIMSYDTATNYLAHYGTPKMRWGQRWYQYEDGSLTPLGRIHYGYGKSKKDYALAAAWATKEGLKVGAKSVGKAAVSGAKAIANAKRKADEGDFERRKRKAAETAEGVAKNPEYFSNDELKSLNERFNTESQIRDKGAKEHKEKKAYREMIAEEKAREKTQKRLEKDARKKAKEEEKKAKVAKADEEHKKEILAKGPDELLKPKNRSLFTNEELEAARVRFDKEAAIRKQVNDKRYEDQQAAVTRVKTYIDAADKAFKMAQSGVEFAKKMDEAVYLIKGHHLFNPNDTTDRRSKDDKNKDQNNQQKNNNNQPKNNGGDQQGGNNQPKNNPPSGGSPQPKNPGPAPQTTTPKSNQNDYNPADYWRNLNSKKTNKAFNNLDIEETLGSNSAKPSSKPSQNDYNPSDYWRNLNNSKALSGLNVAETLGKVDTRSGYHANSYETSKNKNGDFKVSKNETNDWGPLFSIINDPGASATKKSVANGMLLSKLAEDFDGSEINYSDFFNELAKKINHADFLIVNGSLMSYDMAVSYLEHTGSKGMKWGVRRWQNYDGSLTEAGYKHYGYGMGDRPRTRRPYRKRLTDYETRGEQKIKESDGVYESSVKPIRKTNARPTKEERKTIKELEEYDRLEDMGYTEDEINDIIYGKKRLKRNVRPTKEERKTIQELEEYERLEDKGYTEDEINDIIYGKKRNKNNAKHSDIPEYIVVDGYLMHYGVKGQKKGIRQWQNKDGSLTPAGREHYGYGDEKKSAPSMYDIYSGGGGGLDDEEEDDEQETEETTKPKPSNPVLDFVVWNMTRGFYDTNDVKETVNTYRNKYQSVTGKTESKSESKSKNKPKMFDSIPIKANQETINLAKERGRQLADAFNKRKDEYFSHLRLVSKTTKRKSK